MYLSIKPALSSSLLLSSLSLLVSCFVFAVAHENSERPVDLMASITATEWKGREGKGREGKGREGERDTERGGQI